MKIKGKIKQCQSKFQRAKLSKNIFQVDFICVVSFNTKNLNKNYYTKKWSKTLIWCLKKSYNSTVQFANSFPSGGWAAAG